MLIRKEHIENEGLLGIWKISESRSELIDLLPESQRVAAQKYISKLKSGRRILEWLSTRVLLFSLIGKEKTIANKRDGRPFIEDGALNISISHTKDYVAVLLHKTNTVGIDIETVSERVRKIAGKFISEKEVIDKSRQTVHMLLHWSAKETMFKILEESEIDFKKHLYIVPFTPQEKGIIQARECKTDKRQYFRIHYEVHPDFVLTWAITQ